MAGAGERDNVLSDNHLFFNDLIDQLSSLPATSPVWFWVAPCLLLPGMISSYSAVRAELKATRQLLVRFDHAPSVKLTLEPRPAPPTPQAARVLRLTKAAVQAR